MNTLSLLKKITICVIIFFGFSCRVMLIGNYDEVTDQSIQRIQTDVSSLFVKIEKNIADNDMAAVKYENYGTDYNRFSTK